MIDEFRVQLDYDVVKHLLARFVERYMKNYILENHRSFINEIYPDTKDEPLAIKILDPIPILEGGGVEGLDFKPYLGQIRKRTVKKSAIYGWHGDLAILVNSEKMGKRAIIFEIKFGSIQISKAQHKFFIDISESPNKYIEKLNDVKIYIVNCHSLEFKENTMEVRIYPYYFPDERARFNEKHLEDKVV